MAGYTDNEHRNQPYGGKDRNTSMMLGYCDYEFLDASSGDAVPTAGYLACRAISADTTGIVKIDYKNLAGETKTEVLTLVAGILRPTRNVSKLYQYISGSTPGTAKSYKSDGSEITNGIKVHM